MPVKTYKMGPGKLILGDQSVNEQQTITVTSGSSGTYTLSLTAEPTTAIAYDALAADVQAALEALSDIGSGNVTVTGSGTYTVTYTGDLAGLNVDQLVADDTNTDATVATATVQHGRAPLDVSCQVTQCSVEWEADSEDDEPTLCGDVLPGERNYTATLTGTMKQDLSLGGVIDFTWTNKGTQQAFEFVPANDQGREITGVVIIDPLNVGGEARTRPSSDFEWACVGEPTIGSAL